MICSIMQPSYLPWAGYFNLISEADVFVFLDDAQLQKNSWHNRNRLLVNHLPHWITVPVKRATLKQKINNSMLADDKNWKQKHIKLLKHTYAKHSYFCDILELCNMLDQGNFDNLADLNIQLIKWFLQKLDLTSKLYLSSELAIEGKRTERIIGILEKLEAKTYLSPQGAGEYLDLDDFINQTKIKLSYQEFKPPKYKQYRHDDYQSHLSIVDVVANIGWDEAKQYIT
jgi:hypothetical protein